MLQKISTYSWGEIALCKVEFDSGEIGFGQLGNKDVDISVEILHRRVAPALLGINSIDIEWNLNQLLVQPAISVMPPLMQRVLRFELNYKCMGVQLTKALAGVDAAIWDALGKKMRLPIWKVWHKFFFAMRTPNMVPTVYASSISRSMSAKDLGAEFLLLQNQFGIQAFKMKIGHRMQGIRFSTDTRPNGNEDEGNRIRTVQAIIGQECKLAADANGAFHSSAVFQHLPSSLWFLEEPHPWWLPQPSLSERVHHRLAGGEQEFRCDVWDLLLQTRTFDIYQPDFGYAGGPSTLLNICGRTLVLNKQCIPHSPQNDLHIVMAFHLACASGENFVELACVNDGLRQVVLGEDGSFSPEFAQAGVLKVSQGSLVLQDPMKPGWGLEIKPEWLKKSTLRISSAESTSLGDAKRSHL